MLSTGAVSGEILFLTSMIEDYCCFIISESVNDWEFYAVSAEAILTARKVVDLIQSSPFIASYEQQGGAGDQFYLGSRRVYFISGLSSSLECKST